MSKSNHARRLIAALVALCGLGLQSPGARATSHELTITFTGLEAALTLNDDPRGGGNRIASLLVDSTRFGRGGFAGGILLVGSTTPDDTLWLTDPFSGTTPDDNMPALSFLIDPAGDVSGVSPNPFRLFTATLDRSFVGELDFAAVGGTLGSLNLNGVLVHQVDADGLRTGTTYEVNPFTIEAVPIPAAAWLFGSALFGLAGFARRRKAV